MQKFIAHASIILLAFVLFACGGKENSSPQSPYSISGTITDQDGEAVPGVVIQVTQGRMAREVTSDAQGKWSYEKALGTVSVEAIDPAYDFGDSPRTVRTGSSDIDFTGEIKECNEGDSGSESEPCIVTRMKQIQKLRMRGFYALGSDVDASFHTDFEPIGLRDETSFTGGFDGRDFAIRGLQIKHPAGNNIGLFYRNAGKISNLSLLDGSLIGAENVGAIAAHNKGTIDNVHNNLEVIGKNKIGGLVGTNDGLIKNSTNSGQVSASGSEMYEGAGGIVGTNEESGVILASHNDGKVTGQDGLGGVAGTNDGSILGASNAASIKGETGIGGIAGYSEGPIDSSYNLGSVQGEDQIGGIAGDSDGAIRNSRNEGTIDGSEYVGGIVGTSDHDVLFSSNEGRVKGSWYVGGIVGYAEETIEGCRNMGVILGESYVGGVVGRATYEVVRSSNTQAVTGKYYVGGITGYSGDIVKTSYNTGKVTGEEYVGGVSGESQRIENSYNSGYVEGNNWVGGLAGSAGFKTTNSYSSGVVVGTQKVGAIAGKSLPSDIVSSYFDQEVQAARGTALDDLSDKDHGRTTEQMKQKDTFASWYFHNAWQIIGIDYPDLQKNSRY